VPAILSQVITAVSNGAFRTPADRRRRLLDKANSVMTSGMNAKRKEEANKKKKSPSEAKKAAKEEVTENTEETKEDATTSTTSITTPSTA
jgi:hypothetical protein